MTHPSSKPFTYVNSFNPHNDPMRYIRLLASLYRYGNKHRKVEQFALGHIVRGRTRIQAQQPDFRVYARSSCAILPLQTAIVNLSLTLHVSLPLASQVKQVISFPSQINLWLSRVNFLNLPLPPLQICLHFYLASLHPSISRKGTSFSLSKTCSLAPSHPTSWMTVF